MGKAKVAEKPQIQIRDRIKEFRRVRAGDLIPNSRNWRKHPESQRLILRDLLSSVGMAGAVLAYEVDEGLKLLDGHLRQEEFDPEQGIPVLVLDVNEDEANLILATHDLLTARAEPDKKAWAGLQGVIQKAKKQYVSDVTYDMFAEQNETLGVTANLIPDPEGSADDGDEEPAKIPSPSIIKMVQLFLTVATYPIFEAMILKLATRYGKDNATDTVFEALKNQYEISDKRTAAILTAVVLEALRADQEIEVPSNGHKRSKK